MIRTRGILAAAAASLLLTACASGTTFTSTWMAPDAQIINPEGRRVAAVFISDDESARRVAEDTLVRKLSARGAQGVATYDLIPSDQLRSDMARVRERLMQAGVDGIVTMRLIDEKERTRVTYAPRPLGPTYDSFTSYWVYGWDYPYTPASATTETVVRMETLVYSFARETLLWAGTSRTVAQSQVKRLVDEVADAVAKEMTRGGLLSAARQARVTVNQR